MNNTGNAPEEIRVRTGISRLNSTAVSAVTIVFFFLCCIWMLFSVFSFSKTEDPASMLLERDFSPEYKNSTERVKSIALEGIYTIDLTYILPDTQVAAPLPNQDCFGTAKRREDLADVIKQAEEYGLIDAESLRFTDDDVPWSTSVDAQYYLDETILTVSWKALVNGKVYNFTEAVIAHPSQFRKYLTDNKFASGKRKTVSSLSREINAVVGMSADYYAYRYAGVVVQDGKIYRNDMDSLDNCFIDRNGNLVLAPKFSIKAKDLEQYVADHNVNFSLSFGPILVDDGKISPTSKGDYLVGQATDHYSRAAIGQLGELHYLLCTVDGGTSSMGAYRIGTTVEKLAELMHSMGCVKAYTLDGGQTATMTVNGKIFNRVGYGNERPVSDIIYFATALPNGSNTEENQ